MLILQAGDFYMRVGSFQEAIKQYEEGVHKESGRRIEYLKHEIEAYIRDGKTTIAYEKNEQILKADPKDPEARGSESHLPSRQGRNQHGHGRIAVRRYRQTE